MKRIIMLTLCFAMLFSLSGCDKAEKKKAPSESKTLIGYIVIKDNNLSFDEVEIITTENQERIAELGLIEEADYPNGYYILNEEQKEETFKLTGQTVYTFTDIELNFVTDTEGDRVYTTTKKEEFLTHLGELNDISLSEQKIPYFIEVQDGEVISITEKFAYTI